MIIKKSMSFSFIAFILQCAIPTIPCGSSPKPGIPKDGDDFGKGVIFYRRNNAIVGLLLWNTFNKMPIARKVKKKKL